MSEIKATNKYVQRRLVKTPKKYTYKREGGRGKMFTYVKRFICQIWLDTYYPGQWSFTQDDYYIDKEIGKAFVHGVLEVWEDDANVFDRKISAWGDNDLTRDKETGEFHSNQDMLKGAESDALKRCVFTLGGFNDIYTIDKDNPKGQMHLINTQINNEISEIIINLGLQLIKDKKLQMDKFFNQLNALNDGIVTSDQVTDYLTELQEDK